VQNVLATSARLDTIGTLSAPPSLHQPLSNTRFVKAPITAAALESLLAAVGMGGVWIVTEYLHQNAFKTDLSTRHLALH
jgi:hypothetical protein